MSIQQENTHRQVLPRSGKRPIAFAGELLVEGSERTDDERIAYDLAVFDMNGRGYAASLTCRFAPEEDQPRYYADIFDDVDEAIRFFAGYDPAKDIPLSPDAELEQIAKIGSEVEQAKQSYTGLLQRMFPTVAADAFDREDA